MENFIFPIGFGILEYEVDIDVPIILGRWSLVTRQALVDIELGQLKCKLNYEEIIFNVFQSMKQPNNQRVVSMIESID